jgi:hypothetical protein
MKDEEYLFLSDCREKKNIANSARNRRTHCGKGGRVKLPSDYKTKKEIEKMNGEVKTYRLNSPMSWAEFKAMPDEHKVTYIKLLRQKYNAPGNYIAKMMGVNNCYYSNEICRLGLSLGKNCRGGSTKWDKEGFMAWANGVPTMAEEKPPVVDAVVEEIAVAEEVPAKEVAEVPIKDFAPFVRINTVQYEDPDYVGRETVLFHAVPESGSMVFEGNIGDIANTIKTLLSGAEVHLSITWDVLE